MSGARVIHLDEVEPITVGGDVPAWTPLRLLLGVDAFGVNAQTARAAGDHCIEPHDEADPEGGHQELYVVVRGSATVTAGETTFDVHAGSVVFFPDPDTHRSAIAKEAGTTIVAIGAPVGRAFTPSDWEDRWVRKLGLELPAPEAAAV